MLLQTLFESDLWPMYCTSIGLQGRSFQLFLSENKTSLLFRSLIENPGYLKKDDIVCDFG